MPSLGLLNGPIWLPWADDFTGTLRGSLVWAAERPTWLPEVPAWHADAACAEIGGDLWFPELGETAVDARRICSGCPVREPCLQDALEHGDEHGMWGGHSPMERRAIRRQRKREAA